MDGIKRAETSSDRGALRARAADGAKWLGGAALALLLLTSPRAAALGASRAMAQWRATVAPALFPFMALLPLLTCREAAQAYERLLGRAMRAAFRLPGAAAPAMIAGLMAGAPAGAVAAREAAVKAGMDQGQLQRLALSVTGFSPAFLVGGIGAGLLGDASIGVRLLAAQLLTQLTLALLLRGAWRNKTRPVPAAERAGGESPVRSAVLSVLGVCGYMALFQAIALALRARLGRGAADALLCLMDVPSGARLAAGLPLPAVAKHALLSAMCGFGGMCVAAQNLGALKGCGISAAAYLGIRAAAAALSAGYMALLSEGVAGAARIAGSLARGPFAAAALAAALLAAPAVRKMIGSVS